MPISEIFDTMQAYFGNFYINDFVKLAPFTGCKRSIAARDRSIPDSSAKFMCVRNVVNVDHDPLDSVVNTTFNSGPDPVTHFNGANSALVLGGAAGLQLGAGAGALEQAADEILLPRGYTLDWSGIWCKNAKRADNRSWCLHLRY